MGVEAVYGRISRFPQFARSLIAANTAESAAPAHNRNESGPVVMSASTDKIIARAASRSAGARGHRGALGEVIEFLSIPWVNQRAC
jgi:hypothetical protein